MLNKSFKKIYNTRIVNRTSKPTLSAKFKYLSFKIKILN